ncbi:MAG: cysteine synthase CysM [Deltaproteobacteria bacterium]|nr:cysteine synthase CysM [Deltaproteobacteria bacterium]
MKLIDLVGNTPMVELAVLNKNPDVRVLAKLEGNNPAGSVKDRAAKQMIETAISEGRLTPGVKIVEPTSGNTGIALAMIAARHQIEIELVMPESATRERVATMRAFGANVILTPAGASMEGAIDEARRRVTMGNAIMLDQFANPANPRAHYETTGPEIWRDTNGAVTHFVSAMGTTGTIMGCSRYLKEKKPGIQIVGVQPTSGAEIPGIRRWPQAYLPEIFDARRVDTIMDVSRAQADQTTRELAAKEGIFCGVSAGGAVFAALTLARQLTLGTVVVIIPDRGDRYLSTALFS